MTRDKNQGPIHTLSLVPGYSWKESLGTDVGQTYAWREAGLKPCSLPSGALGESNQGQPGTRRGTSACPWSPRTCVVEGVADRGGLENPGTASPEERPLAMCPPVQEREFRKMASPLAEIRKG